MGGWVYIHKQGRGWGWAGIRPLDNGIGVILVVVGAVWVLVGVNGGCG